MERKELETRLRLGWNESRRGGKESWRGGKITEMLREKEPGRVEETESMQRVALSKAGEGYTRGMDAWASTRAWKEETG